MSLIIGVINYNTGNIGSIVNMLARVGVDSTIVSDVSAMDKVDRLILPGVGHFDHGISELKNRGFYDRLKAHDGNAQPLLGICLGMQLLMSSSEEGKLPGLGLLPGTCRKFKAEERNVKVPHMGWNTAQPRGDSVALNAQLPGSRYYFVHSYFVEPEELRHQAGITHYLRDFCSVVDSGDGIIGYQFHPEKSHRYGMALLSAFVGAPC